MEEVGAPLIKDERTVNKKKLKTIKSVSPNKQSEDQLLRDHISHLLHGDA